MIQPNGNAIIYLIQMRSHTVAISIIMSNLILTFMLPVLVGASLSLLTSPNSTTKHHFCSYKWETSNTALILQIQLQRLKTVVPH